MQTAPSVQMPTAFDDVLAYLERVATPQQILAFKASPEAEARMEELLRRNGEGLLTLDEFVELQQIAHLERRMALLKAKALSRTTEGID
ncbi:MAG: hypothetical protein SF029_08075 [bacterium]|nr:hypothetical protein [bacterium]